MPAEFTKERPPINFTKAKFDIAVSESPGLADLPRSKGYLESFRVAGPFHDSIGLKNNTRVLADWLSGDKAQLGLHVCNFTDGTFVTLIWIHTLFDAMGRNALLKAWIAMLEGREEDVPEFIGYDYDPLGKLGAPPDKAAASGTGSPRIEEYVLNDKRLGMFGLMRFVFGMFWEAYWYPKEDGHIICVPSTYMTKLRARALSDLETLDPSLHTLHSKTGKPFLSDGDILMAFMTQLITRSNPTFLTASAATRTINIMNIFGMRDLLSTSSDGYAPLLDKNCAHIANCASAISTLLKLGDFLTMPLGHVAAHIRRNLTIQGTRAQIEAAERLARPNGGRYKGVFVGTADTTLSAFTNWTKAKLFDMDFSAAIVREASNSKKKKDEEGSSRGKPVYIQPDPIKGRMILVRGSANCIGRDAQGNYWLGTALRSAYTENLERAVEEMRRELDGVEA